MLSIKVVFIVLALVCFLLSALGFGWPRANLTPLGLFFWALSAVAT